MNIDARAIPYNPKNVPIIKNDILSILSAHISFICVNKRFVIKVMAITIIMIGLTIPADTLASPSINAPRIDAALP